MMEKSSTLSRCCYCEVVAVYNYILLSFHLQFHPHTSSPLCILSYVYISQQNLLSSSQMAKWIVVDVTVRVVLFSTIAFVVNFLDNFLSSSFTSLYCSFITQGENLYFLFIYIFLYSIRQLLGFCYVIQPLMIFFFLLVFFLHRERFLSHLVGC